MAWSSYSKWDKLELSDDEDTHPGAQFIEANTLRRIKRESHEVKETERREKLATLAAEQEKEDASFAALEAKIVALSASGDDAAAEQARKELWAVQKRMDEREAEVKRLEKERKFNAEEMCHVSKEKTLVGSACKSEPMEELSYEKYIEKYQSVLDSYASRVRSHEENSEFLLAHPEVLHDHGLGYLLLRALDAGMAGRTADMRRLVRQKYHVKSLLELSAAHKAPPAAAVRSFFVRLADPKVGTEYDKAFESLMEALQARAQEKVRERDAAAAAREEDVEELSKEERLGPGGLDPVEVFESLPAPLQEAYEAKDTDRLRAFIDGLEVTEARRIMKLMVGSGLWVPEPGQEGSLLRDE